MTKSLALLLVGLALSQLALPAEAGRPSLRSKDERNQQKREAEQFAAQQATQDAWVAEEQAKLEQQERQEAEKLEEMADVHAVTEAEQLAQQQKKLERLAERENAAKAEQEQLAELSREAERRADEAAREKEKDRRQEEQRQEEEHVQASDSVNNDDNGKEERGTKGNDNDSFDSNNRGEEKDDASFSGGSSSGPIWGNYRASGRRGGPGPAYATYRECSEARSCSAVLQHAPDVPAACLCLGGVHGAAPTW
jgi:TolA-binding protein